MSDALGAQLKETSTGTIIGTVLRRLRDTMTSGLYSLSHDESDLVLAFLRPQPKSAEVEEGEGLLAGRFASGEIFRITGSEVLLSLPGMFAASQAILGGLQPIAPFALALGVLAILKAGRGAIGKLESEGAAVVWATYLRSKGENPSISFSQAVNAERTQRGLDASSEARIADVVEKLISMRILAREGDADPVLAEWIIVRPD